jgi:capsular exopolysaccharide synthesis family protein
LIGKVSLDEAVNTFADMLLAGHEFDQVVKARGLENLNIITSGGHTPNPAELLNFSEMDTLIAELKNKFDIVFFDTPPVLPVTDASILSTKMDGVIFVYQAGKTPRQALVRAKMQLENVKAHIWGVVINNVKTEYLHDVSEYTHYEYYSSHKEKKE